MRRWRGQVLQRTFQVHRPQQRGLAGAVRPEERHHVALLDFEVDVEEDLVGPVEEVEVVDLQCGHGAAGLAPLALA